MEEATGGNVQEVVRKRKQIPEKQAGVWFRQMSDAIDYCHQRGVVHRDLKCEDLLLDSKVFFQRFKPSLRVRSNSHRR